MKLMSPADAMFLVPESADQYFHVGGLQVFELPDDAGPDWVRDLYERMIRSGEIAPLFRQRAQRSLKTLGAYAWAVDDQVDLEHHVRHSALPAPGRVRELLALTSRLHGTALDRHRPLWEAHVIEGLEGGRFAVYTKLHHSLMDGVSSMKLLERSLSTDPGARDMPPPWAPRPRRTRPRPEGGGGVLGGLTGALRTSSDVVATGPVLARLATKAVMKQAAGLATPAPRSIFNVGITGSRRYAAQSWSLDRIRSVAAAAEATVNDVVLAMSASALRRYLQGLDALPDAPLVAMTPVSLRTRNDDGEAAGNAVGIILCNLATDVADPVDRLEAISRSMTWGKEALADLSPAQIIALSAVAMAPLVLGTLLVGRGPREPLYYDGARLQGMFPLSIPTHGQGLNITVTSYDGGLHFGLTGCRRTVPSLQRLLGHLETGLSELEHALLA
jgi:diacylglycerol O-acyltransferase